MPRALSTLLVMLFIAILLAALFLVLIPLVQGEVVSITRRAARSLRAIHRSRSTRSCRSKFGITVALDFDSIRTFISDNAQEARDLSMRLLSGVKTGSAIVLSLLVNLALIPVVMFYLLRDWNMILGAARRPVAAPLAAEGALGRARSRRRAGRIPARPAAGDAGARRVLLGRAVDRAARSRGRDRHPDRRARVHSLRRLRARASCSASSRRSSSCTAGRDFSPCWPCTAVGQLLESYVLVPFLVGDRIGLHPLAVIFALLAFGELFGFAGVLMALPVSAMLLVGLRHLRARVCRFAGVPRRLSCP